jgi:DNA-binding SARP family transcriptional activator
MADRGEPQPAKRARGHGVPVAPIGYGLLGAGIVAILDRMRRAQQRQRPTGLRIALPEGDLVELERGLRVGADQDSVEWVDLSLRLASVVVRQNRMVPPSVLAVRLSDEAVELILDCGDQEGDPPPPFRKGATKRSWMLTRGRDRIEELKADLDVTGVDAPLPSLVTLGRDEHGIFMINIEKAGSIAVSGEEADQLIQGIATELATATWADQIDLVLVGFGDSEEKLERVSHANSLQTVAGKLERRIRERKALLALVNQATNSDTRWLDGGDAWDLCVVVCSAEIAVSEGAAVERIIRLAGDGSLGVAVMCGRDVASARWRVLAGGGRVTVEGAARDWTSFSAQQVPRNLVEGVESLVSVAANTDGVPPRNAPYQALSMPIPELPSGVGGRVPGDDLSAAADSGSQGENLEVHVLGPVAIVGAARQFTRAWAVELVVYLVMHPGGVVNEQWATALWPDKVMAPASLHSTASAARRSLGTAASGEDHLPRGRGRLALGPHVRSDWDTFVAKSRSGAPRDWKSALLLIRGRPFDGIRSPDWVLLEGILATIEAVVVDLASRYAEHCLGSLDPQGSEWAARQGLRVSPYDERLYRILMRSANAAGNPAGVEAIMAELVHLVADDVEPFDAVHPETLALYRRLSRRPLASRSH